MMVMCVVAPVVVSICDCKNPISEGWKKDAAYIAEMFQEKVSEFDLDSRNTDVFFFDGASNVQKAGQILSQTFPRAYSFMVASISCPSFSEICQNWSQFR